MLVSMALSLMSLILMTLYLLLKVWATQSTALLFSLAMTFVIKVVLLPWLLWKLSRYLQLSSKVESLYPKSHLRFASILLTVFAFILVHHIESFIGQEAVVSFSLALANALLALLFIIS